MNPEALADLHAQAFAGQGRAWSASEFASLLQSPHVFVTGGGQAFALGRVVAEEAELLTIATEPQSRGQGLGRAALVAFEEVASARGASRAFLEVAQDNRAALHLYEIASYREIARRAAYYTGADGQRVDAIFMEKQLTPRQSD